HRDWHYRWRQFRFSRGIDADGGERAGAPVVRSTRGCRPEDLPGIQIRGDVRNPRLPGFHRQVPSVYRTRTPEDRAGSRKDTRCVMTCSPFDLRDYFLQELSDPQQRQVEANMKLCQPCREELDRLRVTEAALLCLREEEIPQRIAFVS